MMKEIEKKEMKKFGLLAFGIGTVLVIGGLAAYHFWIKDSEKIASKEEDKED